MERKTLSVSGMSCTGCEEAVKEALTDLDGVSRVEADHEGDAVEVVVEDGVADDDVVTAIEQAGYEVAGA
jgi:copper chaperone